MEQTLEQKIFYGSIINKKEAKSYNKKDKLIVEKGTIDYVYFGRPYRENRDVGLHIWINGSGPLIDSLGRRFSDHTSHDISYFSNKDIVALMDEFQVDKTENLIGKKVLMYFEPADIWQDIVGISAYKEKK